MRIIHDAYHFEYTIRPQDYNPSRYNWAWNPGLVAYKIKKNVMCLNPVALFKDDETGEIRMRIRSALCPKWELVRDYKNCLEEMEYNASAFYWELVDCEIVNDHMDYLVAAFNYRWAEPWLPRPKSYEDSLVPEQLREYPTWDELPEKYRKAITDGWYRWPARPTDDRVYDYDKKLEFLDFCNAHGGVHELADTHWNKKGIITWYE